VLDLAVFFEAQPGPHGDKILVLDRNIANIAIQVDMVEDIISEESVLEREGDDEASTSLLIMADGEVKVLAVQNILEKLEAVING